MRAKRLFLRVMLLGAMIVGGYATLGSLDMAAGVLRKVDFEISVKMDMQRIARFIMMDYIDTNRLPRSVEELVGLIRSHLEADGRAVSGDVGKDMWGTYYRLSFEERGFNVLSAGADKKWRTQDDVTFFQNLSGLGYQKPATRTRESSSDRRRSRSRTPTRTIKPRTIRPKRIR